MMEDVQKISLAIFTLFLILISYLSLHYPYCEVSHTFQQQLLTCNLTIMDSCDQKLRAIPLNDFSSLDINPNQLSRFIYFTILFLSLVKVKQQSKLTLEYSLFYQYLFLLFGYAFVSNIPSNKLHLNDILK